jgi:hypothetical protein
MHRGQKHHENLKNLLPTLDIGSHSNAKPELLPEAGVRYERTLEAVSSRPLFGTALDLVGFPTVPSPWATFL